MIDFHVHLDLYPNPAEVIEECCNRQMFVLSVTNTPSAWQQTSRLAEDVPRIRTALGLHPQLAFQRQYELTLFDQLLPKARYVGEIGLDGAPEHRGNWAVQLAVFEHILNSCASAGGRVMTIHSRRAAKPVLDLLECNPQAGKPILHWFSGSEKDLQRAVDLGCWFSVGPTMLDSANGKRLFALMPRERVLTESDGPFAQTEGRSMTPWDVARAYELIGHTWSCEAAVTQRIISANLEVLVS